MIFFFKKRRGGGSSNPLNALWIRHWLLLRLEVLLCSLHLQYEWQLFFRSRLVSIYTESESTKFSTKKRAHKTCLKGKELIRIFLGCYMFFFLPPYNSNFRQFEIKSLVPGDFKSTRFNCTFSYQTYTCSYQVI